MDKNIREPESRARSQKLKEACDMCSASKIKCNKAKPICSRCEKLGYHCSYSPTRRMGRPHPNRHTPSQLMPKANRDSRRKPTSIRTKYEYVGPDYNCPNSQALTLLNDVPEEMAKGHIHGRHFELKSMIPESEDLTTLQTSQCEELYASDNIFFPGQQGAECQGSFKPDARSKVAVETSEFWSQPDIVEIIPSDVTAHQTERSSTFDIISRTLSYEKSSASTIACDEDCVILAIGLIQSLMAFKSNRYLCGTFANGLNNEFHVSLMKTVTMTIKCISTIMACPCSTRIDVGLLLATLCTSILEVYEAVLCHSNESIRMLGEMPKFASLVMHINKRCCQDLDDTSKNLLTALAAAFRTRIHIMNSEAINCLGKD